MQRERSIYAATDSGGVKIRPIPIVVAGREAAWLCQQFRVLARRGAPVARFAIQESFSESDDSCIVLTDDLRAPALRRLLFTCVDRRPAGRILVLAWDSPLYSAELLRIPLIRLYFPAEQPTEAEGALLALARRVWPMSRRGLTLGGSLPASLAVGLRTVLSRSDDPFGPPPPRTVRELALLVRCSPDTLYRSAARTSIALRAVLSASRARWLLLRIAGASCDHESLARRLGYSSTRSLRRWVRAELNVTLSQLRRASFEQVDARLQALVQHTRRPADEVDSS